MAKIDETGSSSLDWNSSEVYQIEEDDLVQGGEDGTANKQGKELAKRTANLNLRVKDIELLVKENPDGVVNTLTEMIKAFAAFPEGEQALANALASKASRTELADEVSELKGGASTEIDSLKKVYDKLKNGSKTSVFSVLWNLVYGAMKFFGGNKDSYLGRTTTGLQVWCEDQAIGTRRGAQRARWVFFDDGTFESKNLREDGISLRFKYLQISNIKKYSAKSPSDPDGTLYYE